MCGISGLFNINGINGNLLEFRRSIDVVSYRGPDDYGTAYFQVNSDEARLIERSIGQEMAPQQQATLALGHRRLAIIDLSRNGAQPMTIKDQGLWITYNGEIYNYIELREELLKLGYSFRSQSDTEVILAAYAEWGEECVERFNGIWAFAIVDLRRSILFCSRDRLGVKPFHYYSDGERFVFGSEIKQLLNYSFVPKKMNERAIYEYLMYSAVEYGEETFFTSIFKLQQGQNLVVNLLNGSMEKAVYYSPDLKKNSSITYVEAGNEFRRLLSNSVRLQLRSDVEVGSCLSGGLDSSSIVCLMNRQLQDIQKTNIQRTFSSHFEDEEANEIKYMQEVIRAIQVDANYVFPTEADLLDNLHRVVWQQDEPFGSTSIFAQWFVFKLVSESGVKVVLDGQGADEMLAGYVGLFHYYFTQLKNRKRYPTLIYEFIKYANLHGRPQVPLPGGITGIILRKLSNQFGPSGFAHSTDWINKDLSHQFKDKSAYIKSTEVNPFGTLNDLENKLYQLTFINNLQTLLRHEDRSSMAFSVEARVPFLDHHLVEFVFSLPSEFKIRDGYTKRVLRDGMAGILPEMIRQRVGKLGFATPERKWQRTILKPLITQAINSEQMQPFIMQSQATEYYQQLINSEATDFSPWRWLNLFLWMDAYDLA
ncbi:MAG: asparagine synthase (glutamine-hydrolyzing) [Chloroflexi bacterium]|nr:MAG: asparagine synthase (glutamine-hydrolyzing) [Chloroflexota bacterium]MBL1193125.1 asparagine synthase (glutamine-hydrolyzing) [Chloroflexota bacterium]NOH10418.1 asparagine synthase (glutamine-hydrolyzing) [Chloroflexota bacterium]